MSNCSYCGDTKTISHNVIVRCPACQKGNTTIITLEVERATVVRRANHPDHVCIFVISAIHHPADFSLDFTCAQGSAEEVLRHLGIHSSELVVSAPKVMKFSESLPVVAKKPTKVTKLDDFKKRKKRCRCIGLSHRPDCTEWTETL